jgi:cystathionine gamma-synthase
MSDDKKMHPATIAAQGLGWVDKSTGAIVPPLHPSTTFERDPDGEHSLGRDYIRPDNPTFDQAEAVLTALEHGKAAALFASGMAAATAVFLTQRPGDHIIVPRVMYWSLRNWLTKVATQWGLDVEVVDLRDLDAVQAAVRPGKTKLIWTETPANPMWDITDIAAVADIAHKAGARLGVDSTSASPVFTRPLELGADVVMHSATKYLNGHSDVLAGAVITREEDEMWERLKLHRLQQGATLGAFEAWLLMRGMRTLYPRARTAAASAMAIASRLESHPRVAEVLYPGLASFAGHKVAARQMTGGFGGMLSIRVNGGFDAARRFAANVKIWKRATSLGGVESLVEHRAPAEGAGSPCPPDLLRLSTGVEDTNDLIDDLLQALDANA